MKSAADSAAVRFGVRAPQGMRCMRLREGVFSPLLEDPPPSREGRILLALLGGFLDALMVAACTGTGSAQWTCLTWHGDAMPNLLMLHSFWPLLAQKLNAHRNLPLGMTLTDRLTDRHTDAVCTMCCRQL